LADQSVQVVMFKEWKCHPIETQNTEKVKVEENSPSNSWRKRH